MCLDPAQRKSWPTAAEQTLGGRPGGSLPATAPRQRLFLPHTIQDLPSSVPLNNSPGKSQSLHPATGQHVWGQIRRLRGRLGWVRAGPGERKECLLLLSPTPNIPTAFPAPALSRLGTLLSRWHLCGMGLGGEVKRRQECFLFSYVERGLGAPKLEGGRKGGPGS